MQNIYPFISKLPQNVDNFKTPYSEIMSKYDREE